MELLITLLLVFGGLAAMGWAWRKRNRNTGAGDVTAPPPSLPSLLNEEIDSTLAEEPHTFRRPHALQTAIYIAVSAVVLTSFVISFLIEGWSLLSLLLAAAEVLLLFTHGTPLLVSITRALTISPTGIEARDFFGRQSIEWWEVQRVLAAEDLSRFRAEGIRSRLTYDSAAFPAETRVAVFRVIRSHLGRYQRELEPWPQAITLVRFVKANALSLGVFVAAMIVTALIGQRIIPEGNVLGLRCAYASDYLRDKYDLPNRQGCVILRVNPGTGAYKAGLREGDMIVSLEGVPVTSGPQFSIYWESLDRHTQEFTIVRTRETAEVRVKVTLGSAGRLPEYDTNDPYFFYLRARGADDSSQAIRDYNKAIELAPDFDLAYVYRGALYVDANVADLAFADFEKAFELDPELTEAYRERSWNHIFTDDHQSAAADAQRAVDLDGCIGGFQKYNYDCHVNHLLLSYAYGERGDPDDLRRAVEEAEKAIAFYPERPRSYYLAAYYLAGLEEIEEAKDYAERYLVNAEDFEEPSNLIDWAQRLVSGSGFPDQRGTLASEELEPSPLFVEAAGDGDIDPDGEPLVSLVAFSDKRTYDDSPNGARYLTPDRQQLWAYFEFDNAANVKNVYWEWTQNSYVHSMAAGEFWPGTNKGHAWLRLENRFPNENSENTLMVRLDDRVLIDATFHLRNDPYVSPLTFYADAEVTQPLVFYGGQPNQIFATVTYIGALPKTGLFWSAEKDGAQVASGVIEVADSGSLTVPIVLPDGIKPGIIDVRIYLDGLLVRSAALAVAPPEMIASPPFDRFQTGLGGDAEGNLTKVTKEFSRNSPEFRYFLGKFHLPPGSSLTVRWERDGTPLGFAPDTYSSVDDRNALNGAVQGNNGYLEPGEYRVVLSLNTQPVYADVVVVK